MQKLSLAALSLAVVGCGPYLRYTAQPPAPAPAGKIVVDVRDSREAKVGGDHKDEVGVQSGAFGIPTPIKVESPTAVTETMRRLVSEAALAAGLGVAAKGEEASATARIVVDIQRLWCTGYNPAYKGDVTASLSVQDPQGQTTRIPAQSIHGEDGGMDCRGVYKKTLTDFFQNTMALLAQDNIKAAATGANPTPVPPPAQ